MNIILLSGLHSVIGSCYQLPTEYSTSDTVIQTTLPLPTEFLNLLFYIQRNPDFNTVCYAVNLNENGVLNVLDPTMMFWIRYADNGRRQELSYLLKKFAYGIAVSPQGNGECIIKIAAYLQQSLLKEKPA